MLQTDVLVVTDSSCVHISGQTRAERKIVLPDVTDSATVPRALTDCMPLEHSVTSRCPPPVRDRKSHQCGSGLLAGARLLRYGHPHHPASSRAEPSSLPCHSISSRSIPGRTVVWTEVSVALSELPIQP